MRTPPQSWFRNLPPVSVMQMAIKDKSVPVEALSDLLRSGPLTRRYRRAYHRLWLASKGRHKLAETLEQALSDKKAKEPVLKPVEPVSEILNTRYGQLVSGEVMDLPPLPTPLKALAAGLVQQAIRLERRTIGAASRQALTKIGEVLLKTEAPYMVLHSLRRRITNLAY